MELTNLQLINLGLSLLGNNTETDVLASFTITVFCLLTRSAMYKHMLNLLIDKIGCACFFCSILKVTAIFVKDDYG